MQPATVIRLKKSRNWPGSNGLNMARRTVNNLDLNRDRTLSHKAACLGASPCWGRPRRFKFTNFPPRHTGGNLIPAADLRAIGYTTVAKTMLWNIQNWSDKKPLATAGLFLIVAALYFLAPIALSDPSQLFGNGRTQAGADDFAQSLWPEMWLAVAILLAVMLVGWVRRTGLTSLPKASALLLTLPFVAFCILVIFVPLLDSETGFEAVALSASDWPSIWATCIVAVLVGFFEELLFRGVVLQSLMTRWP